MDLSNILSISGKNGLFKLVLQRKNNYIVESFEDGKRFPTFQSDGVSTLDNISIYTHGEMLELKKVFQEIYTKQDKQPLKYNAWTDAQMRDFFKEIIPDYDKDRVFISNIKKIYKWYNILLKNNLIVLDEVNPETETKAEMEIETETETQANER
jgi:hypothetical protein